MVTPEAFKASLAEAAPPPDLQAPLTGLWWAKKGEWDKAHNLVQDDDSAEAAWVHAYLHRVEGDVGNALYWYRRAGKPSDAGDLDAEWAAIAATLLNA